MDKKPKQGYGFIYKYTSPSGKSYIGQTTRTLKERSGHNGKNYRGCKLFYKAIQKYGFDNFDVSILAEVPEPKLDEEEKKYIQIFKTFSPNGYNLTLGGQNTISKIFKKVYQYNMYTGEYIKEWDSAKEVLDFFKINPMSLNACLRGDTKTCMDYCWSYLKMQKFPINEPMNRGKMKTVKMLSLDGELLQVFPSVTKAAEFVGGNRSVIRKCCQGIIKTAYGFLWSSTEIVLENKYNNSPKTVMQIDPSNNNVIHVFHSISEAARSVNKPTSLIRRVLDKENRTAYGYIWKTTQSSTTTYS